MRTPTLDKFPRSVLRQLDIQKAFIASRLVVAAERLQVFRSLHGKGMTTEAIGKSLRIHELYLEPLLNSLVGLGLLRKAGDNYRNTPFAVKYFIEERSIYWTRQYSKECVETFAALTVLEEALRSGKRYESIRGLKKRDYVESMKRDRREAEDFTQMLFHFHRDEAEALAKYLDLSDHRAVLDLAGGSGVVSIALAKKNPHIRACVLDIAPVCEIAAGNIRRARLSARIRTLVGDIHRPLPREFDVVMLCDVGDISNEILRDVYDCLPPGGLLVLADRYLSDNGMKPLDRLLEHFAGSSFGLATRRDMVAAVKSRGFQSVKARNVYQDVWFITATKPDRTARAG